MKSIFAVFVTTTFLLWALPVMAQDPAPATARTISPAADLPGGVIVMWSGALDKIPAGWALCDGNNGTPDLSNRFVVGVGAAEYMGTTGGSHSHRHRAGNHSHQIDPPALNLRPSYGYYGYRGSGARSRHYTLPEQTFNLRPFKSGPANVAPDSVSHLPPYYKIAFIMKLLE